MLNGNFFFLNKSVGMKEIAVGCGGPSSKIHDKIHKDFQKFNLRSHS